MKTYIQLNGVLDLADLSSRLRRLEELGVDGVWVSDHLWQLEARGQPNAPGPSNTTIGDAQLEPFITLAAVGAQSRLLSLATLVANSAFEHPALLVRRFAQLATLFGGHRVLAGIGAGWNSTEFAALGLEMPRHSARMERFEETCFLFRQLFTDGRASLSGAHVTTQRLQLSPMPSSPPSLMLGGGSDALMDLAGKYADHVDLNGSSRRARLGWTDAVAQDARRRLTTTVDDLVRSTELVRDAARKARRNPVSITYSVIVNVIHYCEAREVDRIAEDVCLGGDIEPQSLQECPYVLIGTAAEMAKKLGILNKKLPLSAVFLVDSVESHRLLREVLPLCR